MVRPTTSIGEPRRSPIIDDVLTHVYEIPTSVQPETDGTAAWSATTMVLVELRAGGVSGLGYSYVHASAAKVVDQTLAACVRGASAYAIPALHARMVGAVRNHGREGIAACAIAAVDVALWDLKARWFDVPLAALLGPSRDAVPVYASGGFTSTGLDDLAREIEGYVAHGHRRVKIKIGLPVDIALARAVVARDAAGPGVEVMVDGNGAFTRKQAVALAHRLDELGVVYFEEPVSSDDLAGLRLVRDASRLAVAAGEYAYDAGYVRRLLDAGAVDIAQTDATRCLGISGFLQADAICDTASMPLSAHCAPALHVHPARAARRIVHVESFFDHVRIEAMLFDGVPRVRDGALHGDDTRPGLGLELRTREAARFAA